MSDVRNFVFILMLAGLSASNIKVKANKVYKDNVFYSISQIYT